MQISVSKILSQLREYQFSDLNMDDMYISEVNIYIGGQVQKSGCLYLVDGAHEVITQQNTVKDSYYLYYGAPTGHMGFSGCSIVTPNGPFATFVNVVNRAFLAEVCAQDAITERVSVLARCQSVQQLLTVGSELLHSNLILVDMNCFLVSSATPKPPSHAMWEKILTMEEIPMNLVTSYDWADACKRSNETRLPVDSKCFPKGVFLCTIGDPDNQTGVLLVDLGTKQITTRDTEVIATLCRFLAVDMKKKDEYRIARRSRFDHFFSFLLQGNSYPTPILEQRAAATSWEPGKHMRILVLHSDSYEDPCSYISYSEIMQELPKRASDRVIFFQGDVVLIQCSEEMITEKSQMMQEVLAFTREGNLLVGISRDFQEIAGIYKSYLQARDALDMGAQFDAAKEVYWYEEYADFRLLQMCAKTIDLKEFCHPGLLALNAQDQAEGSHNIETLKVYLENQRSIAKTAQVLHIHRNTVTYRVEHCLAQCKTDLNNRKNLLHVLLSLHIIDFLAINPENVFRLDQ